MTYKKLFYFLDGLSIYNHIQISPKYQHNTTFTYPLRTYAYQVLHFLLCNAPTTFQMESLGIFYDSIHECVEVDMDGLNVYGKNFEEAMSNLEKFLSRYHKTNLSLSHEKFHMLLTEGIFLAHHISPFGIKVDPVKMEVIAKLPITTTHKYV